MSGPEAQSLARPHLAVVSQTPLNHEPRIVNGYDIATVEGAAAYMRVEHGHEWSEPKSPIDTITGYHVIDGMQRIDRRAQYPDGRSQSNAEHSYAVARMGVRINEVYGLGYSNERIMGSGLGHDEKEKYSMDTPKFHKRLLLTKDPREFAGRILNRENLKDMPAYAAYEEGYESDAWPEAPFMDAVDGLEAGNFALFTECYSQHIWGDGPEDFAEKQLEKTSHHSVVFSISVPMVHEILEHWNEWGQEWSPAEFIPVEGDPHELVNRKVREIMQRKAAQAVASGIATLLHEDIFEADAFVPSPQLRDRQTLEAKDVAILSLRRRKDSVPPTRPPSPGAYALAAS